MEKYIKRVAVVGDREIGPDSPVMYHLDMLFKDRMNSVVIMSGGSRGVDKLVQQFAEDNGIGFILFKPYHLIDTKMEYKPRFFFTRNKQIVDNSDEVIVFTVEGYELDGGVRDIIRYAKKRKKELLIIDIPREYLSPETIEALEGESQEERSN